MGQKKLPYNPNVKQVLSLSKPCSQCPFRKDGSFKISPARVKTILSNLLKNDTNNFTCHKTLNTGSEKFCAGSVAVLEKMGHQSVYIRLAIAMGIIQPDHYKEALPLVIDSMCQLEDPHHEKR